MRIDGTKRQRGRRLATPALVLAASVLSMAAPAGAQIPPARAIAEFACPPADVPVAGFGDVAGNTHESAINCVAWYEITTGTTATTYSPADSVPRAQMASFIARLIDYVAARTPSETDGLPEAPAENAFPCDTAPGTHFEAIQRLAAAGIVKGTGDNAEGRACFGPGQGVSRAQMATFIAEAQRLLGQDIPASGTDYFVDDNESVHEANIDAITAEGIAQGTGVDGNGGDLYAPEDKVGRGQMASFLARKLDRLVEGSDVEPPPTATISPTAATVTGGEDFEATLTAAKGAIEEVTVSGCAISPPQVFEVANPLGATEVPIRVTIPAALAGTSCRLDVVATFIGGGRDTSSAIINVSAP